MPPVDPSELTLPFTTRKMLRFEQGVAFGLKLQIQSDTNVTITIRGMTRDEAFTLSQAVTGDSAVRNYTFRLPDIPIMMSVVNDAGSLLQGQCFAVLSLTANGDVVTPLCSGMIYQAKGIAYPSQNLADAMPGRGLIQSKVGTDPVAGAEWSFNVPVGEIWRIMSIEVRLVAAATVGSRRMHIVVTDQQGVRGIHAFSNTDQIISETKDYSAANYGTVQADTDNNMILISLPQDLFVNQGSTIGSITKNIVAGDNYTAPIIVYEKFFVGN